MAAGMINRRVIQLQFFVNQVLSSHKLRPKINTIENKPQGKIRKAEGCREAVVAMLINFVKKKDR